MNERIYDFLVEWDKWQANGALDHPHFKRNRGLCVNYIFFVRDSDVAKEFDDLLRSAFPDPRIRAYPFGGPLVYKDEIIHATMHLNDDRISWVQKMIKLYKPGE